MFLVALRLFLIITCANAGPNRLNQISEQTVSELFEAGELKAGVLLIHQKYGLLLVLGNGNLIFAQPDICLFQSRFRFLSKEILGILTWKVRKIIESDDPPIRLMRAALGYKLLDRSLPYNCIFCNLGHWWAYILKGRTINFKCKRSCPLWRSWKGFDYGHVSSGEFTFLDGRGKSISDFPAAEAYKARPECMGGWLHRMCMRRIKYEL